MYKILIVDDQPLVRMGIRHMLEAFFPRHFILLEAEDGAEGYRIALETNPDIILTDIMMPNMDGLEMIESLQKAELQTVFIVMSAYEEFSFARCALALGVREYLLKPVVEKDLYLSIEKVAGDMIGSEESAYSDLVIYNYFAGTDISSKVQSLRKYMILQDMQGSQWGIALAEQTSIAALDTLLTLQWQLEREVKLVGIPAVSFHNHQNRVALVLNYDSHEAEGLLINALRDAMQQMPSGAMAGVSLGRGTLSQLKVLFRQAEYALEQAREQKKPLVCFTAEEHGFGGIINQRMCRELLDAIKRQDAAAAETVLDNVFANMNRLCSSMGMAQQEYEKLFFYLELYLGYVTRTSSRLSEIHTELRNARSLLALKASVNAYIHEVLDRLSGWQEMNAGLDAVLTYVEMHYDKNINATVLSNITNMSYSYFCSYFAKKMGMTTSEYINTVRLDHARSLLEEGLHSVVNISEQCGFSDYRYFSRQFKKRFGHSPTEHRKYYQA